MEALDIKGKILELANLVHCLISKRIQQRKESMTSKFHQQESPTETIDREKTREKHMAVRVQV